MVEKFTRCQIYLVPLISVLCGALTACSSGPQLKKASPEERAALYVNAAYTALNSGDPMIALEDLAQAQTLNPKMPEIYHTRALVYVVRENIPGAIEETQKALELKPDYSAANTTLGKLYLDEGRFSEAIIYLERATKDPLYQDVAKPLTNLGILYYRTMKYEKSRKYLDQAIASEPKSACVAYYYRGHLHLQKGEYSQAVQDYREATRRFCTDFAEAHLALGIAYERSKQYKQARKVYLDIQDRFSQTAVADQAKGHLSSLP
jgi:type IV pilus assembly protein PilF